MDAQETRKLLELAAKAAGYDASKRLLWRPHEDDGDAMRLACDLSIDILHRFVGGQRVEAIAPGVQPVIEHCTKETRAAAARLAVLRAAAAVGERMG